MGTLLWSNAIMEVELYSYFTQIRMAAVTIPHQIKTKQWIPSRSIRSHSLMEITHKSSKQPLLCDYSS